MSFRCQGAVYGADLPLVTYVAQHMGSLRPGAATVRNAAHDALSRGWSRSSSFPPTYPLRTCAVGSEPKANGGFRMTSNQSGPHGQVWVLPEADTVVLPFNAQIRA